MKTEEDALRRASQRAYEAASGAVEWCDVLQSVRHALGVAGAVLFSRTLDPSEPTEWSQSAGIDAALWQTYDKHWSRRSA